MWVLAPLLRSAWQLRDARLVEVRLQIDLKWQRIIPFGG